MVNFDNLTIYRRLDKSGMLAHLREFPEQCRQAWEKVLKFALPREYSRMDKVIILGMGGSAIGGEIVRRLALAESKAPVWVHRDYGLPSFFDYCARHSMAPSIWLSALRLLNILTGPLRV